MMKITSLLTLFCFCSSAIAAQQPFKIDPALDVYGLDVVFKEKVIMSNCDCCCHIIPKTKKCTLYEVEIKEVFWYRDTSVYRSEEEIKTIKYMVLPDRTKEEDISLGIVYTTLCYNSCFDKMLTVNQLLDALPNPMPEYTGLAYFSGLAMCKDFTFFQKMLLYLRINRKKIFLKAKDMPIERSKFVKAIGAEN